MIHNTSAVEQILRDTVEAFAQEASDEFFRRLNETNRRWARGEDSHLFDTFYYSLAWSDLLGSGDVEPPPAYSHRPDDRGIIFSAFGFIIEDEHRRQGPFNPEMFARRIARLRGRANPGTPEQLYAEQEHRKFWMP